MLYFDCPDSEMKRRILERGRVIVPLALDLTNPCRHQVVWMTMKKLQARELILFTDKVKNQWHI